MASFLMLRGAVRVRVRFRRARVARSSALGLGLCLCARRHCVDPSFTLCNIVEVELLLRGLDLNLGR